eukprot:TRINITY_DN8323_c0_g1_i3.p1 TRINITY_DN8323_c0_g1~~TRINITY_DN8323_c0_g1_i3.p1  ORF type:complete len:200 (-),score=59.12 TRINITY_DN8323_c0_g1_i3:20-619(-)
MSNENTVKLVLLGNAAVGKTSIVERFVFDQFNSMNPATLGVMFVTKFVDVPGSSAVVKLNIWDTAGQEKYHSIASSYYNDADITIIVYDVSSAATLDGAKLWLKEVRERVDPETVIVLVGNKVDLIENEEVDTKLVDEFARANSMRHALVSARNGMGITDLFVQAAVDAMKTNKFKSSAKRPNGSRRTLINGKRVSKCC